MADPIVSNEFRLILVGDSCVGKTTLIQYFVDGYCNFHCRATVAVDIQSRFVDVKAGVKVKLLLWDTAGQERFR